MARFRFRINLQQKSVTSINIGEPMHHVTIGIGLTDPRIVDLYSAVRADFVPWHAYATMLCLTWSSVHRPTHRSRETKQQVQAAHIVLIVINNVHRYNYTFTFSAISKNH